MRLFNLYPCWNIYISAAAAATRQLAAQSIWISTISLAYLEFDFILKILIKKLNDGDEILGYFW